MSIESAFLILCNISVNSQRIFKLNVVEQTEKRITQREIIAMTEKIDTPATIQILLE